MLTDESKIVIDDLMGASSEEDVVEVRKNYKRQDFADACNELGLEVTSSDTKHTLAEKIIAQQSVKPYAEQETAAKGKPEEEKKEVINNPIIRINDRLEAIDLGRKIGVIAIVDGDIPVHVPDAVIVQSINGAVIGRG